MLAVLMRWPVLNDTPRVGGLIQSRGHPRPAVITRSPFGADATFWMRGRRVKGIRLSGRMVGTRYFTSGHARRERFRCFSPSGGKTQILRDQATNNQREWLRYWILTNQ